MSALQLLTEGCALADGQIDGPRCIFDKVKFCGHLCKGELAAPDAPEKGIQNAMLVHGVGAAQVSKLVEVELNGPGRVQCVLMPGGVVQCADILPEHLGSGTFVQPEAVDDAFLCAPPPLAVAAPGSL